MRGLLVWLLLALAAMARAAMAADPDDAFFVRAGNEAISTRATPGLALSVVRHGTIAFEGGFGSSDTATNAAVTARTRFAIGSLTKQLTAAAIELLARDGKLSLDDRLATFVPSLPNAQAITVRMLLLQNSGLHNYPDTREHDWPMRGPVATSSIIATLATDKPDFAPGTQWEYSNANYAALAAVAESAGALPFGELLQRRIFTPLRMQQSGYGYAAQISSSVATGYRNGVVEEPLVSLDLFSGAGGAVSTAHDLALWDEALLAGTLLSKSYLDDVWRDGVPTGQGDGRYAMGWSLTHLGGHRELWHNGLAPGAGGYCFNAVFPDDALAIAVLTNGFGAEGLPERMTRQIAAAYGIGSPPPAPAAPSATPSAAPNDNAAADALARAFWDGLASGTIDRSKLTPEFSTALTPVAVGPGKTGHCLVRHAAIFYVRGNDRRARWNDLPLFARFRWRRRARVGRRIHDGHEDCGIAAGVVATIAPVTSWRCGVRCAGRE